MGLKVFRPRFKRSGVCRLHGQVPRFGDFSKCGEDQGHKDIVRAPMRGPYMYSPRDIPLLFEVWDFGAGGFGALEF